MNLPTISIVIPTFNSEQVIIKCLESIKKQDYPKDKIEIIIADGGSTDNTIKICKKYTKKIFDNRLKTGEAGKAVGVKHAKNEIIALVDSDNILDRKDWLKRMVEPFQDKEIIASEPLYYTYRKEDGYITRYCALLGMNDPLCLFLGNYDRYCTLTGKWTEMPVEEEDKGNYLKISLNEKKIPTIGANGFVIKRKYVKDVKDYLFDIDVLYDLVKENKVAKVKIGIIHLFSGNFKTFIKKQKRRINDYRTYKDLRKYPWGNLSKLRLFKFVLYTGLVFPLIFQSFKGYFKKRDSSWFMHPLFCWGTLLVYGYGKLKK